jgi:hypothetical protein
MPPTKAFQWEKDSKLEPPLHENFFAELAEELAEEQIRSEFEAGVSIESGNSGVLRCVQKKCTRPFEIQLTMLGERLRSCGSLGSRGDGESGAEYGLEDDNEAGVAAGSGPPFIWYDGRGDTIYTLPYGIGYFNEVPPDWVSSTPLSLLPRSLLK